MPAGLQNFVVYGAAIPAYNDKPEAAVAFVKFLSAPDKKDFWKTAGFELISATNLQTLNALAVRLGSEANILGGLRMSALRPNQDIG